jgi:hypothetical protein
VAAWAAVVLSALATNIVVTMWVRVLRQVILGFISESLWSDFKEI